MRNIILIFLFITILFSCKKEELVTVSGNTPPLDNTISEVSIENYINRTFILSLSREPDSLEFLAAKNLLISNNVDSSSRSIFVDGVLSSADFLINLYNLNRLDLLNNADTSDFTNWISLWTLLLQDSANILYWPALNYEISRMTLLRSAYSQYINGSIDNAELQRRMCNNYIYDQINMGSANFVISTFQHLIGRNPTASEQTGGVSMVDGNNAILFLQSGFSKDDYLNILTGSTDYFETQSIFAYRRFRNYVPNTIEMNTATLLYRQSGYKAVVKSILVSDEFIGI